MENIFQKINKQIWQMRLFYVMQFVKLFVMFSFSFLFLFFPSFLSNIYSESLASFFEGISSLFLGLIFCFSLIFFTKIFFSEKKHWFSFAYLIPMFFLTGMSIEYIYRSLGFFVEKFFLLSFFLIFSFEVYLLISSSMRVYKEKSLYE